VQAAVKADISKVGIVFERLLSNSGYSTYAEDHTNEYLFFESRRQVTALRCRVTRGYRSIDQS
jgi:hypothetical protein